MLLPMALLLTGCLAIGLRPGWALRLLQHPLSRLAGAPVQPPAAAVLPARRLGLAAAGGTLRLAPCC